MRGTPGVDFGVVAGEEDVGDFEGLAVRGSEGFGAGVLGVFEVVAVGETFDGGGVFAAENAGEEAGDCVDDGEGGEFAAGKNVVADGDLCVDEGEDAFVVAFIVAADEDEVLVVCGIFGG